MRKHIKITAQVVPNFTKVLFKVLEQTNKGRDFGDVRSLDSRKFVASNGIVLASNSHPARDTDEKNVIWLRGSKVKSNDSAVECTKAEWEKIVAAVKEYNAFDFADPRCYAAPKAPAPRKPAAQPADFCAVIIG